MGDHKNAVKYAPIPVSTDNQSVARFTPDSKFCLKTNCNLPDALFQFIGVPERDTDFQTFDLFGLFGSAEQ